CKDPDNFVIQQEWLEELEKCANRDTAPAFFEGVPGFKEQMFGVHNKKNTNYDFVGLVLDYNEETQIVTLQQRNHFKTGQEVEFFGPEIS
ncbi:U32 family peptidase C-terminal domain-containing protein, partial [Planococcus sp. SIMBA_143]